MITNQTVYDNLNDVIQNKITANKKVEEIKTLKESIKYIKKFLVKEDLTKMVKVNGVNLKNKLMYTIKFMGRIYLEDFNYDTNFNKISETIITKINGLLKVQDDYASQVMNHKARRRHLKNTKYFKEKNKKTLDEWFNLIKSNNMAGKEKQSNFLNSQIRNNIEFFVDREISYRSLLSKFNYDGQEIESMVSKWYEAAIKEDSFMSEK